jgi:hypothetical protein
MTKDQKRIFKRDGLYEQICWAVGMVPRDKNFIGYFTRDELMQLLLKLNKGHLEARPCSKKEK